MVAIAVIGAIGASLGGGKKPASKTGSVGTSAPPVTAKASASTHPSTVSTTTRPRTTTTVEATTTTGPYDNLTGVQMGQNLCQLWSTSVRDSYMSAPWNQANTVILNSSLQHENVAMNQGIVNPPGSVEAAITVLETPASSDADRTSAAQQMDQTCAGLKP
ncbi:MAG: hypothetical protein M0Z30_14870 [Actinomycetota bacterium]|nr:hypothetical protein [Actinomycetota bacterium]